MIYKIPVTKEDKIQMIIHNIKLEISKIKYRGSTWLFNSTTGESEFIGSRKLSEEEAQRVEELKTELKRLEVELKLLELSKDFENEKEN